LRTLQDENQTLERTNGILEQRLALIVGEYEKFRVEYERMFHAYTESVRQSETLGSDLSRCKKEYEARGIAFELLREDLKETQIQLRDLKEQKSAPPNEDYDALQEEYIALRDVHNPLKEELVALRANYRTLEKAIQRYAVVCAQIDLFQSMLLVRPDDEARQKLPLLEEERLAASKSLREIARQLQARHN
jgi:chromosome segregation ATPase